MQQLNDRCKYVIDQLVTPYRNVISEGCYGSVDRAAALRRQGADR